MKKINYLLVGLLAATVLVGCGKDKGGNEEADDYDHEDYPVDPENIKGGTFGERMAIREAANYAICAKNGNSPIDPEDSFSFEGAKNDFIKVTTSQAINYEGESYTVKISWTFDETKGYTSVPDDYHIMFEFNFPKYGEEDITFDWSISSMTCGDASTTSPNIKYSAVVKANTMERASHSIAEINKVTDGEQTIAGVTYPSTFDIVNYEGTDKSGALFPYYDSNGTDGTYIGHYARVVGEVVWYAPDGNWALLADGDQILEFYTGAGTKLTPKNFPELIVGHTVAVEGKLDQYCGNVQIGIITKIGAPTEEEAAAVSPWTGNYPTLTEDQIAAFNVAGYSYQKQAIDGFMNALRSVTGTLVPGSIKDKNGTAVSASSLSDARFTFEIQVGDETLLVAYDYHTNDKGDGNLFDVLKAALTVGGEMTIKGTMRYAGNDSLAFNQTGYAARWSIVPFLPSHVA